MDDGGKKRRHLLHRRRQVDDGPVLRRRLPDLQDRLADLLGVVELGARKTGTTLNEILDDLNPEAADDNQPLAPPPQGGVGAVDFLTNYIVSEAFAIELAERGYPVTEAELAIAAEDLAAQMLASTVGVPFDEGVEIRIDQPDQNGVGEIVTRHPNMFAGYHGVAPWTRDISHGELLRDGYDETMILDLNNLRFLFQGRDPAINTRYHLLPYRLGLLTAVGIE